MNTIYDLMAATFLSGIFTGLIISFISYELTSLYNKYINNYLSK
jgi:hypothetical protein